MTGPALAKPMFLVDDDPPPGSVAAKINAVQSAVTASASFLDYDGSTSIDFGDYFAFADKFGLATGDTGFDAAYDADGSGKVEYGDFFIFGDNFGTAAAGAFKYDPPGPGAGPFTNAAATFALSGSSTVEVGAGQTLQVGIDATGLVGAKQFEVVLEVSPASAFNLSSPTFALGGGFTSAIAPGVLSPAAAQVKGGAAFLTGSGVDGASALGTFTLTTAGSFIGTATVQVVRIAVGSSSTEQDVFATGDLNLSVTVVSPKTVDFDNNGTVAFDDFFILADNFGKVPGDTGFYPPDDVDGSNKIDYGDLFILADNFGLAAGSIVIPDPPGPGTGPFANAAATFAIVGPPADEEVGPGQTFDVDVLAFDLVGVEQYEIILELDPPEAFDLANSSFANGLPSALTLGIEPPASGQLKSGAAILSGTPFTGDEILGTFTLKTSEEFANDATVLLGRVAIGSSSTEQDVFLGDDLNLSFTIAPRVRIAGLQREAVFPDEPLNIFAQISPGDAAIASFQAKIRPEDSLTPLATLSLADDGTAPDATAGDHTYSAQWSGSSQLGNYTIDLLAEDVNAVSLPVSGAAGFVVGHTIVSMPNKMLVSPEELATGLVPVLIEDDGDGYLTQRKFKSMQLELNMEERVQNFYASNLTTDTTGTELGGLPGSLSRLIAWSNDIMAWDFDISLTNGDSLFLSGGPAPDQAALVFVDLELSLEGPGGPQTNPGSLNFNLTGAQFDGNSAGIGLLCCGQVEVGRGDVDTSGTIEAFDASLALMHTVRRIDLEDAANELNDPVEATYGFTLPLYAGHMADVSGEMGITALDAALILQREVNLITHFPSEVDYYRLWEPPDWWNPPTPPPTKPVATSDLPQRREITLGSVVRQEDGSLAVPVLIDDMEGVLAGTFALTFLPHHLEPIGVRSTELTREYLFADHSWADSLRFSFAGVTAAQGSGPVAELLLRPLSDDADLSTALALAEVQLNEGRIEPLFQARSALPSVFALYANYPNPFNPQTTLRYDLPRDGRVRLTIYNLVGQRVRTLVDRHQSAGHYRLTWDGKDDAGFAAASGLYLYRLESATGSLVRKMLMVK